MIHDDFEFGKTLGNAVDDFHHMLRHQNHQADALGLRLVPHPVVFAFNQRLLQHWDMERKAHAEHARLFAPAFDFATCIRGFGIETSHDGETIRMRLDGHQRKIIALALP